MNGTNTVYTSKIISTYIYICTYAHVCMPPRLTVFTLFTLHIPGSSAWYHVRVAGTWKDYVRIVHGNIGVL